MRFSRIGIVCIAYLMSVFAEESTTTIVSNKGIQCAQKHCLHQHEDHYWCAPCRNLRVALTSEENTIISNKGIQCAQKHCLHQHEDHFWCAPCRTLIGESFGPKPRADVPVPPAPTPKPPSPTPQPPPPPTPQPKPIK